MASFVVVELYHTDKFSPEQITSSAWAAPTEPVRSSVGCDGSEWSRRWGGEGASHVSAAGMARGAAPEGANFTPPDWPDTPAPPPP